MEKIRNYISVRSAYEKCEAEIRSWVERAYPGLSIDFAPHMELVQTDKKKKFGVRRVKKITEVVNIKIGNILEKYAEDIYLAELLERIYARHPEFNIEVESNEDIKNNEQFLQYLKELRIGGEAQ